MSGNGQSDPFAEQRLRMCEEQLVSRGIRDPQVLAAMQKVPRHEFLPPKYRDQAYGDHPIPIGEGQTISQPYIVAVMLQMLALRPVHTVLEVGTGSGYQTALLAEIASRVFTIERHASLAGVARSTLTQLGYANVTLQIGDGSQGLEAFAPFDAIIVSAASPHVPPALLSQLREDGRMVVPVGNSQAQELQLVRKQNGSPVVTATEGCRFVPLVGSQGFPSGW
ncbi:MAG TPA: protein-L-isoaspartate(D-aspartate) O-methyltransferase [Terriglobales bacterium]|nr:protein-L-isoaspartate(D-aspartate) O-methyltransferase [Terriglobales bacterium]